MVTISELKELDDKTRLERVKFKETELIEKLRSAASGGYTSIAMFNPYQDDYNNIFNLLRQNGFIIDQTLDGFSITWSYDVK